MFCSSKIFIINKEQHRNILQAVRRRKDYPLTHPHALELVGLIWCSERMEAKDVRFALIAGEELRRHAAKEVSEKPLLLH